MLSRPLHRQPGRQKGSWVYATNDRLPTLDPPLTARAIDRALYTQSRG